MSGCDQVPTFGRRVAGAPYVVRPSAYAIARSGTRLAVVETIRGRFLPGGGLRLDEDPETAMKREALEECGLSLSVSDISTEAVEIVYSPTERTCFEKRSTFAATTIQRQSVAAEQGHRLLWLSVPEALETLSHESHRWAVRCLISGLHWEAPSPAKATPSTQIGPGMPRSQLLLVPHDPTWSEWFASESTRIRDALQGHVLRVEHIGSTAVPGMLAKPIIDIAAITPTSEGLSACVQPLVDLGYDHRGQNGDDILRRYFVQDRDGIRIAQLHLWTVAANAWRAAIAFRDLLRRRPDLRIAYAEAKLRAAEAVGWNKAMYSVEKGPFIESVIQAEGLLAE